MYVCMYIYNLKEIKISDIWNMLVSYLKVPCINYDLTIT